MNNETMNNETMNNETMNNETMNNEADTKVKETGTPIIVNDFNVTVSNVILEVGKSKELIDEICNTQNMPEEGKALIKKLHLPTNYVSDPGKFTNIFNYRHKCIFIIDKINRLVYFIRQRKIELYVLNNVYVCTNMFLFDNIQSLNGRGLDLTTFINSCDRLLITKTNKAKYIQPISSDVKIKTLQIAPRLMNSLEKTDSSTFNVYIKLLVKRMLTTKTSKIILQCLDICMDIILPELNPGEKVTKKTVNVTDLCKPITTPLEIGELSTVPFTDYVKKSKVNTKKNEIIIDSPEKSQESLEAKTETPETVEVADIETPVTETVEVADIETPETETVEVADIETPVTETVEVADIETPVTETVEVADIETPETELEMIEIADDNCINNEIIEEELDDIESLNTLDEIDLDLDSIEDLEIS